MKKVFFRIFAYVIDLAIITIIVSLLGMVLPFSNRDRIVNITNDTNEALKNYSSFISDIDNKYLEDNVIDNKELNEIKKEYNIKGKYNKKFKNYVQSELDEIHKLELKDIMRDYTASIISKNNYKLSKANIWNNVVELIVCILYFGVLQFYLKGKTVGKKLMRLTLVNAKDEKEEINLPTYIVRSLMVTTILFSIGESVFALYTSFDRYSSIMNIYSNLPSIYILVMLMFVLFRDDQKGLHDCLLGTRIKLTNKDGSEYINTIFKDEVEETQIEEKEEKPKKKSTKKTSTKRTIKKKKEND